MAYDEAGLNQLRWRCRRGMLELDLLLGPFFEDVFVDLGEAEQETFVRLLAQDDPDLNLWFSRKSISEDPEMASMVRTILDRVQP